jgi:hypothetical protein
LRRVAVVFTRSRTAFAFVGAFRAVALVQLPLGFEPMICFAPFRPPLFLPNPVRALANLVCVVRHDDSLRCFVSDPGIIDAMPIGPAEQVALSASRLADTAFDKR